MTRTYDLAAYDALVARLRAAIPGVALSTDIIVGFPGETEDDFERTAQYMREVRYDSAFLFKYSARPDTKAHRWPESVSEEEKGRRLTRLIDQQNEISAAINASWVGREVEVLVEGAARRGAGQLYGKSPQFKAVVFADDGTPPGQLRRVRILGATSTTLIGEAVGAPRPAEKLLRIS
jgi:tRNA-2-methylthio-N6-dimethylallyladenosine synthase